MIQILIAVLSVGVASISCFWKIARDMRLDIKKEVDRMYERFDMHKRAVDAKFLLEAEISARTFKRTDTCELTQQMYMREIESLKKYIESINVKIDKLLEEKRAGSH